MSHSKIATSLSLPKRIVAQVLKAYGKGKYDFNRVHIVLPEPIQATKDQMECTDMDQGCIQDP
jgi:hypothetical protein